MFKRLMICSVAVGLVAIFTAETVSALSWLRRRSVGVSVEFQSGTDFTDQEFTADIYGLPADGTGEGNRCGVVTGQLYCAENDTTEARLACETATGGSNALLAIIDPDGHPVEFSTSDDYNFSLKEFGQRLELLYFRANGPPVPPQPKYIHLPAGTKKTDAGFHFVEDPTFSVRDFVGTWDNELGKFIPENGYGINGEQFLDAPLLTQFGGDLQKIDGRVICAVWHHDQVKFQGDSLKGNYYGVGAFLANYDSTTNTVIGELMDAYDACGGLLYSDVNAGVSSDVSGYECQPKVDYVFAPAPATIDGIISVDAFKVAEPSPPYPSGKLQCSDPDNDGVFDCSGSLEVVLDPVSNIGQELCNEYDTGSSFVDFIPINRGGLSEYGAYAFYANVEFENKGIGLPEREELICSEGLADEPGVTNFSQYVCKLKSDSQFNFPADDEIPPTCVGLGQTPWKIGEAVQCPE